MTKVSTPSNEKIDKVSNSDLSRTLRAALGGITQAELAARLLVSRNYVSQIEANLKTPSERLRADMVRLLTESANADKGKDGGRDGYIVKEDGHGLRAVPRQPSTRADCADYFAQLLHAAEISGDPNAFPVIHDRLKKQFPLGEWVTLPPPEERKK